MSAPRIAIVGIGNLLLSDDGLGIHVLRRLRAAGVEASARLIDGGTVGTDLLAEVWGCERLLIIDAVDADLPPGAAIRMDSGFAIEAGACARNAHQAGIPALLDDLKLMGCAPREIVLLGLQPATLAFGTKLSPEVAAAVPALCGVAARLVERWVGQAGPPVRSRGKQQPGRLTTPANRAD